MQVQEGKSADAGEMATKLVGNLTINYC